MTNIPESSERDPLSVRVRMYCHGLGDCFLLTFNKGDKTFNMMIDCGVLQGTNLDPDPARGISGDGIKEGEIMRTVVKHIAEETGGRLNAVVVTHEHHDHICGFKHAQEIFDDIDFDEVWLGWTEDEGNKLAQTLQQKQQARAQNLKMALTAMRPLDRKNQETIESFLAGFSGDALKASPGVRAPAWQYIAKKKRNKDGNPPKYNYCYPGREPLELKGFEQDVRIYVLGPPDDPKKLRDLSAPANDRYRHDTGLFMENVSTPEDNFFLGVSGESNGAGNPFRHDVGISEDQAQKQEKGEFFFDSYYSEKAGRWRTIDADWLAVAGGIALKMDSYTNNTSLVLAIELIKSGKVLLFVGDAQFGNWESWHDYEWSVQEPDNKEKKVKTEDLLGKTVLYKVGHHGSHNATLKERGLEMMTNIDQLVAMIPVDEEVALGKKPHKWEMPFAPLLDDLKKKTNGRVIASDKDLPGNLDPQICIPDKKNLFYGRKLFIDYIVSGEKN